MQTKWKCISYNVKLYRGEKVWRGGGWDQELESRGAGALLIPGGWKFNHRRRNLASLCSAEMCKISLYPVYCLLLAILSLSRERIIREDDVPLPSYQHL